MILTEQFADAVLPNHVQVVRIPDVDAGSGEDTETRSIAKDQNSLLHNPQLL